MKNSIKNKQRNIIITNVCNTLQVTNHFLIQLISYNNAITDIVLHFVMKKMRLKAIK